jgi:N-methylhydantoinase B
VEIAEVELPVRFERYSIEQNTGGPGKHRGALAQVRQVKSLAKEAILQIRSDKRKYPPYGLHGGKSGSPSWNILNPGEGERLLPTMGTTEMKRGDVIRHVMAGGGGWGDPLERDPEAVEADIRDEKVTIQHALREYGVVIDPKTLQVDLVATVAERRRLGAVLGPPLP